MDQIDYKVIEIISSNLFQSSDLKLTTELDSIDGWSSIIYVLIIQGLEEFYQISFPSEKLFDVETIGDLSTLIKSLV